jgi:uncharacterized protein YndB with AHSA1/START domain
MRFSNTITIHRPPREVFAYLAEFENLPRWNYAISQTRRISAGPVGVGSSAVQVRTLPRPSEETLTVTEYEPDRRLAVHGTFGPLTGRATYLLELIGDSTRLTNEMDLAPSTGASRLLAPLAVGRVKAAVAANLGKLKDILEEGGPT